MSFIMASLDVCSDVSIENPYRNRSLEEKLPITSNEEDRITIDFEISQTLYNYIFIIIIISCMHENRTKKKKIEPILCMFDVSSLNNQCSFKHKHGSDCQKFKLHKENVCMGCGGIINIEGKELQVVYESSLCSCNREVNPIHALYEIEITPTKWSFSKSKIKSLIQSRWKVYGKDIWSCSIYGSLFMSKTSNNMVRLYDKETSEIENRDCYKGVCKKCMISNNTKKVICYGKNNTRELCLEAIVQLIDK